MEKYTKGNLGGKKEADKKANEYIEEYGEQGENLIFMQPEGFIEALAGEDVERIVRSQKETAGGMGQWMPAEFKLLSREACNRMAEMFMMIEEGAS